MVKVKVEESRYETKGADPRLNKVVDLDQNTMAHHEQKVVYEIYSSR